MMGDCCGMGMSWWMSLLSILFLTAIVIGVVLLVKAIVGRTSASGGSATPDGQRALNVLDERYARGEIDRNEFEERRRTLTSS